MKNKFIVLFPVLAAISMVYVPSFWINLACLVDHYTPWVLFESPIMHAYHGFLISKLQEQPETPLPEITKEEATMENIIKHTHAFSFPLVIRGLLGNTTGVQHWGSADWWIENYGEEEMLCGTLTQVVEDCTVNRFFQAIKDGNPFYISGASEIFNRHPELHPMIDNQAIRDIEPSTRTATQIFMGLPGMGSDIHSAIGVNIFRQIAGQKKWWFIPPDQTVYLMPSINVNGFSSHTGTKVGKNNEPVSPWLSKVKRYTSILNPGDVLINPPWYWHGIMNLGKPNDIVIGSPTRYGGQAAGNKAALKTNLMFSLNAFVNLAYRYGITALKPGFKINLQADIANNRRDRDKKPLKPANNQQQQEEELHPFDQED